MSSISGWTEGALFSILFVAVLSVIIGGFNVMYDEDNVVPFADNSGATTAFIESQENANTQIQGGEAAFDAREGITLKSSWAITKDLMYVTWAFITGGWIEDTVGAVGLGESGTLLALYLRILYVGSLIFAILYVLFKTVI